MKAVGAPLGRNFSLLQIESSGENTAIRASIEVRRSGAVYKYKSKGDAAGTPFGETAASTD